MNISAEKIFNISSEKEFTQVSLAVFKYQSRENPVYSAFVNNLGIQHEEVNSLDRIPFLPIEFFKSQRIISGQDARPEIVFSSSGTTGANQSRHPVRYLSLYEESFRKAFDHFYGNIRDYTILALLPSYLEREGSSLIYMVDALIRESGSADSGYFLYNHSELYQTLLKLKEKKSKVILIGVTYALLDFTEAYPIHFPELIVMETGGMKGKRKEMIREELHEVLARGFGVSNIHSEYGMTELLSQAYSAGTGVFRCPPWMKVLIRDTNDPLSLLPPGKTGGLNIIDLANLHSCSFIATQDLGRLNEQGSFEVLGRFDDSDIRGCNLLVQ